MPATKRDVIAALQADGKVTAMVGDGVNDAATLAHTEAAMACSSVMVILNSLRRAL